MLPFLQPKRISSIILQKRSEAGKVTSEQPDSQIHPKLLEHAANLITGIANKDQEKVAQALQGVHEHLMADSKEEQAPAEGA